jgi:ABC-type oligopeptide transport system substrate-binding subunit
MVAVLGVFLIIFTVPALAQTPKKGGVFRVGILAEPPALDPHWTTAAITGDLANHIFEGLYALDENYRPIPM